MNIISTIERKEATCICHILRRKCFL